MEKIVIDLEAKTDKALKEIEGLKRELSNTDKEVKKVDESTSQMSSTLDKATGGAITKFKGLKGALKTAVTGFKSLRVAIISTGIGALLIAVTALGQAFTRSEEGQNKFAKLLGVIGSVTGNLLDLLADLGEGIISVFKNPKQAIKDFVNLIKQNIQNRFEAILDTVGFLGSAIKKVFKGDFSGAVKDAKNAGSSLVDSFTGVKNTIDKVRNSTNELAEELKKEAKIAANIADQRARADRAERALLVARAKANRDRADLLDKAAQKEKFTAQERIEFLEEAGKIDEEITNKEIAAAKLRLQAKVAENALTKSTKEDLDEEANLRAKLIDLETQRLTKQKTVSAQIVSAKREEKARLKAIEDEEAAKQKERDDKKAADDKARQEKEIADAKALADLKNQIRDAEAVTEEERRLLEIEKTTEHYDKLIELARAKGLATEALENAKTNALNRLTENRAKNEIQWEKLTQDQKVAIVSNGFKNLSTVLGQETAAGKAAAIAAATIDTYQSATASYKSLAGIPVIGPTLGIAAAGAAIASGLATVKQIVATKTPNGRGVSAPSISASSSSASAPARPPSFNVVGASETNQLAEAIGGQTKEPVKAYVVSDDVSTAQSLDRNIVQGASI